MKPSDRDIHRLVEKFTDGGTTLSEEHELYAYFRGNAVADDLQPMRELFLDWRAWTDTASSKRQKNGPSLWPAAYVFVHG